MPSPPAYSGLASRLRAGLTDFDLNQWRVTLYSGIGCATEGINVGRAMLSDAGSDPSRQFDALYGLGRALFHRGYYRQAAACYSQAADRASEISNQDKRVGAELQVIDAERCAGLWRRAWSRIEALNVEVRDPWLRTALAFRKIHLLRQRYQITITLRRRKKADSIKQECRVLLRKVATAAGQRGAWLELQQCELWASRLQIPFTDVYIGPLNPLPSREGYRQLGYFVAESMALRDAMLSGPVPPPGTLGRMVKTALALGAGPEAWKWVWTALRNRRWWPIIRRELTIRQFYGTLRMWLECEYTLGMRVLLLFRP